MESAVDIVNGAPAGELIPAIPYRPVYSVVNIPVGDSVLAMHQGPVAVDVPTQAHISQGSYAGAVIPCQSLNIADVNSWIPTTNALPLEFKPTHYYPVSDNWIPWSSVCVMGQSQYCPMQNNTVPPNPSILGHSFYAISNNTMTFQTLQHSDIRLSKLNKSSTSRGQSRKSQHEETPDHPVPSCPPNKRLKLSPVKGTNVHEEITTLKQDAEKNCGRGEGVETDCEDHVYKITESNNKIQNNFASVVLKDETKIMKDENIEMDEDRPKSNKSIKPCCVKQSGDQVCKSVDEVCHKGNENMLLDNNSLKNFQKSKAKQNYQSSDSSGTSKKQIEELIIEGEDFQNKTKIISIKIEATETSEVITIDDTDDDAPHCKTKPIKIESEDIITIDDSYDSDSKSRAAGNVTIVKADDPIRSARTGIIIKTEENSSVEDLEAGVIKTEMQEVPEMKTETTEDPELTHTPYHVTDDKEHGRMFIKELADIIKVEWSNNLFEEVSDSRQPNNQDVGMDAMKEKEYCQTSDSRYIVEDYLASKLVIDEIKEENMQTDLSDMACSGNRESVTSDHKHLSSVMLEIKSELGCSNIEDEITTAEIENCECSNYIKCLCIKDGTYCRARCITCKKAFPCQELLLKHILTHTGGKVFSCDECHMKFNLMSQLSTHKDRQHMKSPHKCKYCNAPFNTRSKFMSHLSMHTGERPYYCDGCGDTFLSNSELIDHRLKSGEQPFYCDKCGERFPWKSILRVHENSHSEIKRSVCPVCFQAFQYSVLLLIHRISAGHGLPFEYEEQTEDLNDETNYDGGIKCVLVQDVNPMKLYENLLPDKQRIAVETQANKIQEISEKIIWMNTEDGIYSAEVKDGTLSQTRGKRVVLTCEVKEGVGGKRICISETQNSSKYCKYICPLCNVATYILKDHIRMEHKFGQCLYCSFMYSSPSLLKLHMNESHKEYLCSICDIFFLRKGNRDKHMKGHEVTEAKVNNKKPCETVEKLIHVSENGMGSGAPTGAPINVKTVSSWQIDLPYLMRLELATKKFRKILPNTALLDKMNQVNDPQNRDND